MDRDKYLFDEFRPSPELEDAVHKWLRRGRPRGRGCSILIYIGTPLGMDCNRYNELVKTDTERAEESGFKKIDLDDSHIF